MKKFLIAFFIILLLSLPVEAARKSNGTSSDTLISASTLNFSPYTKYAIAFWFYVDSFSNNPIEAFETWESGIMDTDFQPDSSGVGSNMYLAFVGNIGLTDVTVPRPSGAAWHHMIANYDQTLGSNQYSAVYVDGVSQTITYLHNVVNTGNFLSTASNLYLLNHRGTTQFGIGGRIADVAIWFGNVLTQSDATNLANGTYLPDSQLLVSGQASLYWKICGANSPELPTLGTIKITVTGTVDIPHPPLILRSCQGRLVGELQE